jgi:hypothetical protein
MLMAGRDHASVDRDCPAAAANIWACCWIRRSSRLPAEAFDPDVEDIAEVDDVDDVDGVEEVDATVDIEDVDDPVAAAGVVDVTVEPFA